MSRARCAEGKSNPITMEKLERAELSVLTITESCLEPLELPEGR